VQLLENNCMKTNEDRRILSAAKSSAGSLLSGNISFVWIFAWLSRKKTLKDSGVAR